MKFEQAIEYILKHEGGHVNHSKDPGGETKFGISKRSYPHLNIFTLTLDEAVEIYRTDFWDRLQCEALPPKLRLIVFDCAINQGPSPAIGLLQAALGVKVDGVLGPLTLKAAAQMNEVKLVAAYARLRLNRYWDNPNFGTFGEGWTQRLLEVAIVTLGV